MQLRLSITLTPPSQPLFHRHFAYTYLSLQPPLLDYLLQVLWGGMLHAHDVREHHPSPRLQHAGRLRHGPVPLLPPQQQRILGADDVTAGGRLARVEIRLFSGDNDEVIESGRLAQRGV